MESEYSLNEAQLAELKARNPSWEIISGEYHALNEYFVSLVILRRMTDAELDRAVQMDVSYSQHSSIVASIEAARKSMTYDLTIGQCNAFEFKDFWKELLLRADWRRPGNPDEYTKNYYQTGILDYEKIKKFMNKPEREKGMPDGELGVLNEYIRNVRMKGSAAVYSAEKLHDIDISKIEYTEDLQWPMPDPEV